jgi:hypothetical protein
MTRRTLLALPFAMALRADSARDVWDLLGDAASALSNGNAPGFLEGFDPKMPGYEKLRVDIEALVHEVEPDPRRLGGREGIFCSIGPVSDKGDDHERELELDWILDIRQQGASGTTRRQQNVKIRVEKQGKKWRIVAFDPPGFFAPPDAH